MDVIRFLKVSSSRTYFLVFVRADSSPSELCHTIFLTLSEVPVPGTTSHWLYFISRHMTWTSSKRTSKALCSTTIRS